MRREAEEWARSRLKVRSESGDELSADCPLCGGVGKLWINVEKGVGVCYRGCFRGGVAKLVSVVDGVTFGEASRRLEGPCAKSISDLRERFDGLRPPVDSGRVVQGLPAEFEPCYDGQVLRVPSYLERDPPGGRGLDDETIARHGLGFASAGKYRDRLIVPVHCDGNRTFLGRLMGRPEAFAWRTKGGERVEPPRYLSPRGANLGRFLYWFDHTPRGAHVVVVEGVFDAIRLTSLGFHAVATFGKSLSPAQLSLVRRLRPSSITVLYDSGAVAEAYHDAAKVKRVTSTTVLVGTLDEGDPDSVGFASGRAAIAKILATAKPVEGDLAALRFAVAALANG